jgi:membrane-bound ClpP family serine protease
MSVFCRPEEIDSRIADAVLRLQGVLNKDVWVLAEGIDYSITLWWYYQIRTKKVEFAGKDVVLILDSFGGSALAAYRIATLFQRNAKSFTVVVPRIAKSAATLLALGADEIILGDDAELGPLDVQIHDYDVAEDRVSALDTVQSIEQLEESAIDVAMRMLKDRTKKRANLLLEPSLKFAA